jgi:thiol:disulfide interchange protein DsbD
MHIRRLVAVFVLILFTIIFITAQVPSVSAAGSIDWNEFDEGMEASGSENKPVLIDFYTDWCGYCDDMDEKTYSDSKIISKAANFVCIKVDGDDRTDLVSKYDVDGYPTTVFLDSSGKKVHKVVGYIPADEFIGHMEYALGEREEPPDVGATCCTSTLILLGLAGICMLFIVKRFV